MAKMTHGVEVELQKHMDNLELRVQRAGAVIEQLEPELDSLREKLAKVERYISKDLDSALKKSSESISNGLNDAANLRQILAVMMQTVLDGTSHVSAAQERSMEVFDKGSQELKRWAAVVATASGSALSLNSQIVRDPKRKQPQLQRRLISFYLRNHHALAYSSCLHGSKHWLEAWTVSPPRQKSCLCDKTPTPSLSTRPRISPTTFSIPSTM